MKRKGSNTQLFEFLADQDSKNPTQNAKMSEQDVQEKVEVSSPENTTMLNTNENAHQVSQNAQNRQRQIDSRVNEMVTKYSSCEVHSVDDKMNLQVEISKKKRNDMKTKYRFKKIEYISVKKGLYINIRCFGIFKKLIIK